MNSWTDEKYKYLCETCDEILLSHGPTVGRVAISGLHILNEHPVNLARYHKFFNLNRQNPFQSLKSKIKRWIRFIRSIHLSFFPAIVFKAHKPVDVLIISHLLAKEQLESKKDFYFGTLSEDLANYGFSSTFVLHNHTAKKIKSNTKSSIAKRAHIIFFERYLPWKLESKAIRLLKDEVLHLKNLKKCDENNVGNAYNYALEQAEDSSTIYALGIYFQIKQLVINLKPKAIILTYEGHAWERLAFAAAREVIPTIRCIGYQHSMLLLRQHSLKRLLGLNFDPDVILTAGSVTRDMLRKSLTNNFIEIHVGGTHRFEPHNLDTLNKKIQKKKEGCLVIPDGTLGECIKILDFTLEAAKLSPLTQFIVRMHPVIAYEKVCENNSRFRILPKNIELSCLSINEDFERCRWAIYRASTAAIYAVVSGLRPFYISSNGELNIDPLFKLKEWRSIIGLPNELICKIECDLKSEIKKLESEWIPAKNFCTSYVEPYDFNIFARVINGLK